MVEINWTKQAIKDIDNIAAFISRDSEHYAMIQVQRFFEESVRILERYPRAGKIVREKQDPSIREVLVGSYRVIYKVINKSKIDVLTVHHSKRMLANNPRFKK
ncbi:type II toxin-antitoxin system RelE/ParE family toxin [Mucilaginibacter ginsenosidivorax]|uniref:Type II toxin-antitoxin system RelE/ParE family toxin n=1 Tax=Mucilaginibacter ginsenosidivorax TaxID=862126 RepID=A0A5B8W0M8_9SPHI|nr:type II toxin-antitoxin system RelE/ParE family toxin [Mucilaginibacter ginsenosidivorax]QEC77223.1 type II toxin-antitoxin system RelE/ParE family toxin [Mucilaginibacter ginsenosidivorax]